MGKILVLVGLILLLLIGGTWWSKEGSENSDDLVSRTGIHWHPTLEIYVNDEVQEIPQNLGIIGVHGPMHTHEDLPNIHLEFEGMVIRNDIKLQRFFDVWNKEFNEFGDTVVMTVNGEVNEELGEYEMRDGDKIVLRYEDASHN